MIKKTFLLFLVLFFTIRLGAEEYLYPVGLVEKDGQAQVYMFYQKSIKHIELWAWDPGTKNVNKALLSSFTPAGLRMLPDNSGFSFIDNGRIKVKLFNKRSPKSIDIYEPIYDIGVVEWIDADCCFFSAKENEATRIYQANMRGEIACIAAQENCDCIYPQKAGSHLFYIERNLHKTEGCRCISEYRYRIVQIPFPTITYDYHSFNSVEHFDERVDYIIKNAEKLKNTTIIEPEHKETIAEFSDEAIAFLHMESDEQGYVLGHPNKIDRQDKTILLSYYKLRKEKNDWSLNFLFSFEIPMHFLLPDSPARLYESILPLLPRRIGNYLYFVDCARADNYNLNIYSYSFDSSHIQKHSDAVLMGHHFFAPILVGPTIYFGGSIMDEVDPDQELSSQLKFGNTLPSMRINDGSFCFVMPFIKN